MIELFSGTEVIDIKWWNFPAGERGLKIVDPSEISGYINYTITLTYQSDQDLIDLLLLVNACRNAGAMWLILKIPYFPYARQDRLMVDGESFSLQVAAQLINSCNFEEIEVWDPHSDVLAGLFPPGKLKIKHQCDLVHNLIRVIEDSNSVLVSPDAGASKKIYKLAQKLNMSVIEASKVRDCTNGQIIDTKIDENLVKQYQQFFIVDDICGGGVTFIELAKKIKQFNPSAKLILVITHGVYNKTQRHAIECYFDEILCVNDMMKD